MTQKIKKPECEPYQQFSYLMNLFHGTYRSDYTNFAGASIPLDVFPNPECLIEELHKSITNNVAGYVSSLGTKEIREIIANYENTRTNNERYSFENVALIPGSATEAISYAFDRIFHDNKGELLISLPNYWLPLEYMKRKLPKVAVRKIHATAENNFLPSIEQIRNNLSEKTRALFICNPLNPSGRAHSNEELEKIISIAAQHGTYVILDESCYDQMYPGNKTPCTQSNYEKLIIIRTWSKDRGRPDFNLGYMIASPELLEERSKGVLYDDPGRIFLGFIKKDMQMRTLMLKEKPSLEKDKEKSEFKDYKETINSNISTFRRNVEYAMKRLRSCKNIDQILEPEGGFTLFFHTNHPGIQSGFQLVQELFNATGLTALPGSVFGMNGDPTWMRISLAWELNKPNTIDKGAPKTYVDDGIGKLIEFLE